MGPMAIPVTIIQYLFHVLFRANLSVAPGSRESIRAGKKRKGPTQEIGEIDEAVRPGPSTPKRGRHRK
jgi:hypothetical protein